MPPNLTAAEIVAELRRLAEAIEQLPGRGSMNRDQNLDHAWNAVHAAGDAIGRHIDGIQADAAEAAKDAPRPKLPPVPADWPIRPLRPGEAAERKATCGTCRRSWDDAKPTSLTPAPGGRCPFEAFHLPERPTTAEIIAQAEAIAADAQPGGLFQ